MSWKPMPRLAGLQAELTMARAKVSLDPTAKPVLSPGAQKLLHANRAERRAMAAKDRAYGRQLERGRADYESREHWRQEQARLEAVTQEAS